MNIKSRKKPKTRLVSLNFDSEDPKDHKINKSKKICRKSRKYFFVDFSGHFVKFLELRNNFSD